MSKNDSFRTFYGLPSLSECKDLHTPNFVHEMSPAEEKIETKVIEAMPHSYVTYNFRKECADFDPYTQTYSIKHQVPNYRVIELIDPASLDRVNATQILSAIRELQSLTEEFELLMEAVNEHEELSQLLKGIKVLREIMK